jgi:hypothetical protein
MAGTACFNDTHTITMRVRSDLKLKGDAPHRTARLSNIADRSPAFGSRNAGRFGAARKKPGDRPGFSIIYYQ